MKNTRLCAYGSASAEPADDAVLVAGFFDMGIPQTEDSLARFVASFAVLYVFAPRISFFCDAIALTFFRSPNYFLGWLFLRFCRLLFWFRRRLLARLP